jgi:hypothetical protein
MVAAALVIVWIAIVASFPANAQPSGKPLRMNSNELRALYSGKTWMWEGGGGYLAPDGRFEAFINKRGEAPTYAEGDWWVTTSGLMCFKATWHLRTSSKQSSKCFGHLVDGNMIFQREEPQGFWYAFRTETTPHPQDEFNKLLPGNLVSAQVARLRAAFTQRPATLRQR